MKILHVITGLAKAAGTSTFCGEVCNQLAALGHDVTIAVCNPKATNIYPLDPRVHLVSIESIIRCSPPPPPTFSTFSLVHLHALWTPILHKVSQWAHKQGIPVIWSPHGMITPWAMNNKRLKKLLGWHLYQKRDLQSAALLHATAQSEVDDIRRLGLKNGVIIAPLGVKVQDAGSHPQASPSSSASRTLLFVSRVQRKKGLPMLLDAWAQLSDGVKKSWHIRIVGPDQDNHTAELMSQCDRLGISYSSSSSADAGSNSIPVEVEFVGPKFGDDLAYEYASADLFVLPTHSENFGSVVIEALAYGVPVICTKGAPWAELETYRCGSWIDVGVSPLRDTLSQLLNFSSADLRRLGQNGLRLVKAKYTWGAVAETMLQGYKTLIPQGIL